ncbi:MAG TPA: hypothetical protein VGN64_09240, partial [Dyadobacter sp.]|nr:hypothetical protein [Dyadobacter sp.]
DETKVKTALQDVLEQVEAIRAKHDKHSTRIRRKHAAEDKYGCILRDDKGAYRFTKAGEEKAEDELTDLHEDESLVEIEPVIVEVPDEFPREILRYFKGFVFEQ